MQRFDLNQIAPSPWKNGGGSTREIACFPAGAGMDSFGWRISVATIAQAGPFSAFAGVDRQITLLDGDGVHLHSADGQINHALDQRWKPFAFSGDVALDCTLLGDTSTDFNVMTRRDAWVAKVMVVSAEQTSKANYLTPAGLCMVLDGSWSCAETGDTLDSGQGVWWTQEQMLTLAPQEPQARLVFVGIAPK